MRKKEIAQKNEKKTRSIIFVKNIEYDTKENMISNLPPVYIENNISKLIFDARNKIIINSSTAMGYHLKT